MFDFQSADDKAGFPPHRRGEESPVEARSRLLSPSITVGRPGQFDEFARYCGEAMERAALRATAKAARAATTEIRAGLPGRLGRAIGTGSDLDKRGAGKPEGEGFSASGWIHVRGRGERTVGAIIAATEGVRIAPVRGQWLAFPTNQIPQRAGRLPMTPDLYKSTGLEESIGPLEFVRGRGGRALFVVRGPLSIDRFRRRGRYARRLPRRGRLGETRRTARFIVAFILIRSTERTRRVDPASIAAAHAARLPDLVGDELRKETGHAGR